MKFSLENGASTILSTAMGDFSIQKRPPFPPRPAGSRPPGARPAGGGFSRPASSSGPRPAFNRDNNREPLRGERTPGADEPKVNEQIKALRIRLIDDEGTMQGVIATRDALAKAEEAGLDLVEISPNADPPVCKILDYGKYRYQLQKKKAEAKKKQKTVEIKELKLRSTIEQHDLDVKLKAAIRFLEEGDKVKFTLRFRGREMAHQHLGMALLQRVKETLGDKIRVDLEPRVEGNQAIMMVSPAGK
jgi:translation initiation factor IF-3